MKRKNMFILFLLILLICSACSKNIKSSVKESESKTESSSELQDTKSPQILVEGDKNILKKGESVKLSLEGISQNIIWTSSDPYCISINENGIASAGHKGGEAIITAAVNDTISEIKIKNEVFMRDISSSELVAELKFGGDWNDQVTIVQRNVPELTSMPIFSGITFWNPEETQNLFLEMKPIMLGKKIHQEFEIPVISDELSQTPITRLSMNFWHVTEPIDQEPIMLSIENAKLTYQNKTIELKHFNGIHKIDLHLNKDEQTQKWFRNGAIGDQIEVALPLPKAFEGGVFSADVTLESFESDFEDIQRYLCASTGGDVPLTEEMILAAKEAGFDYLRIPFTFSNFMSEDFDINSDYLDELEQVVNMVLDAGLYCLIDSSEDYLHQSWVGDHWDENWLAESNANYVNDRYRAAWMQIAERFKNYDEHLLFGNFNEFAGNDGLDNDLPYEDSRFAPSMYEMQRLNEMTQIFVDTVVGTGGNNAKRHLYISAWNGSWEKNVLDGLEMPNYDRLIGSVHYYYYTEGGEERIQKWSRNNPTNRKQVDLMFSNLKETFLDQGIPVILTEIGNREMMPMSDRIDQATYILETAKSLGIPCTWFEGGGWFDWENGESMALYDRNKLTWQYPELLEALQKIYQD